MSFRDLVAFAVADAADAIGDRVLVYGGAAVAMVVWWREYRSQSKLLGEHIARLERENRELRDQNDRYRREYGPPPPGF